MEEDLFIRAIFGFLAESFEPGTIAASEKLVFTPKLPAEEEENGAGNFWDFGVLLLSMAAAAVGEFDIVLEEFNRVIAPPRMDLELPIRAKELWAETWECCEGCWSLRLPDMIPIQSSSAHTARVE